jgi:aminoglycoside phosphotransferase (APT) family kinase protein
MTPGRPLDLPPYRDRIAAVAPELADLPPLLLGDGWDSVALEVAGWIFKFPREAEAAARLRREHDLLRLIRPRLTLPVPDLVLHDGGGTFSQHRKLPGESLETVHYLGLPPERRDALAATLARLYAELHAIPIADAEAAGAQLIDLRLPAAEILSRLRPKSLPPALAGFLEATMAAYGVLPDEPGETTYGYFDGHGWNMAFDHATGTLNGVFDFADSGIGPRHRDLSYASWIHPDLSRDIARRYSALTGYPLDPERVVLHNSALRFSEYAEGVLEQVVADPLGMLDDYRLLVEGGS